MKGSLTSRLAIRLAAIAGAVILGVGSAYVGFADFGNRAIANNSRWTSRLLSSQDKAIPYVLGHYLAARTTSAAIWPCKTT